MVAFNKIGQNIAQYTCGLGKNKSVSYNSNALKELSGVNSKYKEVLDDVFMLSDNPSLSITAKDGIRHARINISGSEFGEQVFEREFVLPKGTDISTYLPQVSGAKTKVVLDNKDIIKLTSDDNEFGKYIANYVSGSKNPSLEISTKDAKNYSISTFVLKDGDEVLTQGAYSISKDANGNDVVKYHFSNNDEISTGFKTSDVSKSKKVPYMKPNRKEQVAFLSEFLLNGREAEILKKYFGIGTPQKSLAQIGDSLFLTKQRCRQILDRALEKLEGKTTYSPELKIDLRKLKPSEFLTETEKSEYRQYCLAMTSERKGVRESAMDGIKYLEDLARARQAQKVVSNQHG